MAKETNKYGTQGKKDNVCDKPVANFNNFIDLLIQSGQGMCLFVAPALAGRHRRASFHPFVRSSIRPSVNI